MQWRLVPCRAVQAMGEHPHAHRMAVMMPAGGGGAGAKGQAAAGGADGRLARMLCSRTLALSTCPGPSPVMCRSNCGQQEEGRGARGRAGSHRRLSAGRQRRQAQQQGEAWADLGKHSPTRTRSQCIPSDNTSSSPQLAWKRSLRNWGMVCTTPCRSTQHGDSWGQPQLLAAHSGCQQANT